MHLDSFVHTTPKTTTDLKQVTDLAGIKEAQTSGCWSRDRGGFADNSRLNQEA
jgi:hypothetical protein